MAHSVHSSVFRASRRGWHGGWKAKHGKRECELTLFSQAPERQVCLLLLSEWWKRDSEKESKPPDSPRFKLCVRACSVCGRMHVCEQGYDVHAYGGLKTTSGVSPCLPPQGSDFLWFLTDGCAGLDGLRVPRGSPSSSSHLALEHWGLILCGLWGFEFRCSHLCVEHFSH